MADAEGALLRKIAKSIPAAAGYRDAAKRADTDRMIRGYVAEALEALRGKIGDLRAAAQEEGEEDLVDDLTRLDERVTRTVDALREAQASGSFLAGEPASEEHIARVCAYDRALLEDLELLTTDVMGMKYETIGNLTLREVEGTLAGIELKVANRRDVFETSVEEA